MSKLRRILYILVFLVFLTGCGGSSLSNFSTTPPRSASASNPNTDCQPPSLDNCFTEDEMKVYLEKVSIPDVEQFSQDRYSRMPLPKYVYIPEGQTFNSQCGQLDESTYAYCPSDDTVYIGQKTEWYFYQEYGAVSPVLSFAHEFGHHIQFVADVPKPTDSSEAVNHENQADCISGAWVRWAAQKHMIEYPKDVRNLEDLLIAVSEAEGPNQTHGTPSERLGSVELGYSSGLSACNSYYPNQPILQTDS